MLSILVVTDKIVHCKSFLIDGRKYPLFVMMVSKFNFVHHIGGGEWRPKSQSFGGNGLPSFPSGSRKLCLLQQHVCWGNECAFKMNLFRCHHM